MKQQNFLFVDIISSIFLLVILIGNFMGLLYITDGNLVISMLGSMFLVICYFFVVQFLKKNKELMIKKNFLHPSSLFWIFFLLLGFVSFNLMSHFINVEYNCKDQIKKEATYKIKLVDSIASIYKKRAHDDLQSFDSQLKNKLRDYKTTKSIKLREELVNGSYKVEVSILSNPDYINVNEVASAKVNPYDIKINKNIENIDKTISINNKNYQSVFDNWKRLSLVATYAKLNQYVEANVKSINSKIGELPLNKTEIKLVFDKKQLPLNSPTKLNIEYKPNYMIPTVFIILTHLFILIPFFTWRIVDYVKSNDMDPLAIENVREI
ncbi:hypothetical protein [Flavobacterium sp.]|uniref:hypothetical protein n=1 Tax=Flavobacterium sp. TaxID=239 RepID=UPI00248A4A66|nr:hypothetical protein [Flavobacterium sp.]MDI1317432.1 hypothetical protein [Flavobacterium sp.]